MFGRLVLCFLLFLQTPLFAQYFTVEKELIKKVAHSKNDSDKIKALGNLAEFYYIYRAEKKGDSVLNHQLILAELSTDKKLIVQTLFGNALTYIGTWTSIETFDKALGFLNKGLQFAKELNNPEYELLAHIRKANILKKRGQYDNAIQEATMAFSNIHDIKNDSLQSVLFLTLSDIYLIKGDAVTAYKNLNSAFDIAYKIDNIHLQSQVYHMFSALYEYLDNKQTAKANLLKSLELNTKYRLRQGLLLDYIDLARLTDELDYIQKASLLADSLQSRDHQLFSKKLMFAYLIYVKKNVSEGLSYLKNNEDLSQSYLNSGIANYYWNIGNIYFFGNQPDSALKYFSHAEPDMEKSFELSTRRHMYGAIGDCYLQLKQPQKAIPYFEKSLAVSKAIKHTPTVAKLILKLGSLYAATGAYDKAYAYNVQYLAAKDSLDKIAAERDVVLLEVDRENKKHAKDMMDLAAETVRKRNLQYIGISILIATVFFLIILLGMFPVSKFFIKMISFFAFICLFEFIVLLIDSYLHTVTHGEPLKIWLVKIFLIALLVPLQHFMEHAVVRFLESRKLLKMRQQFSVKRVWQQIKKPTPHVEGVGFEKDTAVL